jgi:hypothetical protein
MCWVSYDGTDRLFMHKVKEVGNWQFMKFSNSIKLARATHFTGYCCWFMCGFGQHNLLGIVVGLRGASGNTLYWVLLLVYVGPRATHFTGYCCWFTWGLGQHTLLDIVVEYHKQNHMVPLPCSLINLLGPYTNLPQSDKSHIHKLAPSGGQIYASNIHTQKFYFCSNKCVLVEHFSPYLDIIGREVKFSLSLQHTLSGDCFHLSPYPRTRWDFMSPGPSTCWDMLGQEDISVSRDKNLHLSQRVLQA